MIVLCEVWVMYDHSAVCGVGEYDSAGVYDHSVGDVDEV